MERSCRHDIAGSGICTADRNRPLDFEFDAFEKWLRSEWNVIRWRYADWTETRKPYYNFIVSWGAGIGWEDGVIEGIIPEGKYAINWMGLCSADFVIEFVRKFVSRFPANKDLLCFHDGDGGFSLYESDLNDDDLYDRIVGEPTTLDEELQRKIIAAYSQGQEP